MAIYDLKANLDLKQNMNVYATCKQLDNLNLILSIYDNSVQVDLSSYTVRLKAMKADKVPLVQHGTGISISNNVVTIECDEQLTTTSGKTLIELQFIDNSTAKKKATFNLVLIVIASTLADGATISKSTYTLLEELENKMDQASNFFENIDEAITANNNLQDSISTGNTLKTNLDNNITTGNTLNNDLETNISAGNILKPGLEGAVTSANTAKAELDISIQDANTFVSEHGDIIDLDNRVTQNTSQLNENTNEIEDTKTDLEVIKTNYAKKTDVNSLASSKAEKVDLQATNAELATQKARIDTFTKLSEGSTTGDAELADIRTKSDGTISVSSGDAVRNQIKSIVNFNGTDIYKYDYEATVSMMVVSNLQIFRGAGYEAHKGAIIPVKANTTYKLSRKKSTSAFKIALLTESEAKSSDTLYLNLNRLIINDNNVNECIFNSGSYTFIAYQNSISNESSDIYLLEDYKVNLNEDLHIKEVEEARIDLNNKKYNNLKSRLDDTQKQLLNSLMCSDINVYDEEVAETYNDYNKFPVNKIILVSAYQNNILNAPYVGFIGTIFTYSAYKNANVCAVQIAIDNNNVLYFRSKYGSDWISWKRNITYTPDYSMMFHKIGGVGDSLMSGELAYGLESENWQGHYLDKYEFSWLSNIARTTGAEYKCYSEGGLRCDTWLEKWKDKLANDEKKCNAYFIGLGTNDKSYSGYSVGTVDDTSSTVSFAGYYKKIIETIQTSAPNAVIFCLSLYDKSDKSIPYSNMVQAITSKYNKCYFLDFANKSDILLSDANYTSWGHFDTLGYIRVAENIKRIINDVVETNRKDLYMFGWNN